MSDSTVRGEPVHMARELRVIEVFVCRGKSTEETPWRHVHQYWSMDGELLAEHDPNVAILVKNGSAVD